MKLIPVIFYGHTTVDKRFSSPMLPWIVSEIRRTQHAQKVSIYFLSLHYVFIIR